MQTPTTTVEFLNALKTLRGFRSDYQLWKWLGWTSTTISNYRSGRSAMGAAHAIRIADELAMPRAYVLACVEAERERNDQVAGVWREIAHRFKGAAAIILIVLAIAGGGDKASANPAFLSAQPDLTSLAPIYIMRSCLGDVALPHTQALALGYRASRDGKLLVVRA